MERWQDWKRYAAWELYLSILGLFVVIIISPIILLIFIPTLIWRPIATSLRQYFRPDLGDILSCTSSALAQVDNSTYTKSVIVIQISFQGVLNYETLLTNIQEHWIHTKDDEDNLRYPELQQFITNWACYKFWKWEEHFNIRNHIHLAKDSNLTKTKDDLHAIGEELLCGSFQEGKSPWDITLASSVIEGHLSTVMFFRVHHALADGYSVLSLFQRLMSQHTPQQTTTPKPAYVKVGYILHLPCQVLRIFGEMVHNTASPFLWKIPEHEKSPIWSYCVGRSLPVSTIIQVKNHFGVSFTAVVFALLCGGINRFIAKHEKERRIMALPAVITVPVPGHQDKLCNKFSFAMSSYPVGTLDPIERLKILHHNFEYLRDSPVPIIGYGALRLHGAHFNAVGKLLNSYRYAPFVTSYFPVRHPQWTLQGCPLTDIDFYLRLQQGQQGAMFCISAFKNNLKVTPVFNASLLSNAEVAELCDDIEQEIKILADATIKTTTDKKFL